MLRISMSKYSLFVAGLLLTTALCFQSSIAHAGGSSFAIRTAGKTAFVKPGQSAKSFLQLHIETYFNPANWAVRSLRIDRVMVECTGDNVMKNATLRLGTTAYGSAIFKKIPHTNNHYQATIQPKNLILQNDSLYTLQVDGAVRPQSSALRATLCRIYDLDYSASQDGHTFVTSIPLDGTEYDIHGFSYMEDPATAAVVVGSLTRFQTSPAGASFNLPGAPFGAAQGMISRWPADKYQFTLQSWDKTTLNDYVLSQHPTQAGSTFDVRNPSSLQKVSVDRNLLWEVQEVHFYPAPSVDGTIGTITLGVDL